MKSVDMDIRTRTEQELQPFIEMAETLGYSAILSGCTTDAITTRESPVQVYRRHNLKSKKLSELKAQVSKIHGKYALVSAPLLEVDTANWVAEDSRVHLLTVDITGKNILRKTTAGLCASHGTALEVPIASLLDANGLNRSRIIKAIRDCVTTATRANMKVVLSSGANTPVRMRSPVALFHIGMLLGLEENQAKEAILSTPSAILKENLKRLDGTQLRSGLEIIRNGEENESE
ncbi:MAG: RNase P subunit p30 family protein [Candidatus Thorarchaeota archaeon]|nr:RNase P subunit p30 family protein [Candidatus Thorarchaeota archaeon]